jgi:hypothetical protein
VAAARPQAIPGLSPVPWYTTLFPLALVLTLNAVSRQDGLLAPGSS